MVKIKSGDKKIMSYSRLWIIIYFSLDCMYQELKTGKLKLNLRM